MAHNTDSWGRAALAIIMILSLLQQPGSNAQTQAPASPREDIGWPRQVSNHGADLVYYHPQVDFWQDYKTLSGKLAFSLTDSGNTTLGVADFRASTVADHDTHTVFLREIEYTSVRFPSLDAQAAPAEEQLFRTLMPTSGEPISGERVMADMERTKVAAQPVQVNNQPPQIFTTSKPAILLTIQGDPVLAPIEKTNLQFVVNTTWDLFLDKSQKRYFLFIGNNWLTAQTPRGPWAHTRTLPTDMAKLPSGDRFDAVKKAVSPPASSTPVPTVFFSNQPAELILIRGTPVYTRIPNTQLLYIANTDSDIFVDNANRQYYVLLSGRWFRATSMQGPWSYAGNDLPADFARIPVASPKVHVLAYVPGTVEASDAIILAQIPIAATLQRTDAEAKAAVRYDGTPQFTSIAGTSLQYAINTQEKVIQYGNDYYLCFQGVWFLSATPNGPWRVADTVPKEIYTIPPSSPVYNVTYVTQTTTTATVDSSYTAGYLGMFVVGMAAGAAIAFGTGYYYPPYVYWGGPYPIYRPWPYTYGAGVVYNPWTGGFAAHGAIYGPYAAAGASAWYNPATGRYGRSATVQGYHSGRSAAATYNPWTGAGGATVQGHNAYAQWGHSAVTNGDQWARTGHVTTANGTAFAYQGSGGQAVGFHGQNGTVVKGNDYTYAGNDGSVYRKNSDGKWSKWSDDGWTPVDNSNLKQHTPQGTGNGKQLSGRPPSSPAGSTAHSQQRSSGSVQSGTLQGLDNSAASRQRGQQQTRRFQNFNGLGPGRSRAGGIRRR